ncbi:MAG: TniB family NTP-binding protein [Desulfuromonadales bacterium]|nr:TniB family NTP-binding protein [Desulfuromonadales bacterium]
MDNRAATRAERIDKIKQSRWIGYPKAQEILKSLDALLSHPKVNRMPNMLIVGPTNNGKSELVKRFQELHPARDNPKGNSTYAPVVVVQAPPVPDENRLYNNILTKVFCPHRPKDPAVVKEPQVLEVLNRIGVRILIIDEIHSILAGSTERQRQVLNVIRRLGNELKISIVAVGIKDAFRAIQTDPQLANRFKPALLEKWTLNNDYLRLLASFEKLLDLEKPSRLHETSLATRLLSMSEGTIGELSTLLNDAAEFAIESGEECITHSLLDRLRWLSPSDRKNLARMVT